MKRKKDGSPAVSAATLEARGELHRIIAQELQWLITRSRTALFQPQGNPSTATEGPIHVVGARRRAEAKARQAASDYVENGIEASDIFFFELLCLLDTLDRVATHHRSMAETNQQHAQKVGPGRPTVKKIPTPNQLQAILDPRYEYRDPQPPPQKPGPTPPIEVDDQRLLAWCAGCADSGRTIRDVVQELAEQLLKEQGRHAAGKQLKAVTLYLEGRRRRAIRCRG